MLDWSLCIATLNRHDVLMVALTHVLRQTRLPREIIIVDASENWQDGRARAQKVLAAVPDIPLHYVTSDIRSSATQRNLAIDMAKSEIIFFIDDDSFLHDDFAQEIMRIFEADTDRAVVGIGASLVDENPAQSTVEAHNVARKDTGTVSLARLRTWALETKIGRWINRELLFQSAHMLFMRYDEPRMRPVPNQIAHLNVVAAPFMPGSAMTFRRDTALKEPFDRSLRYYAAFEDLDMAYRLSAHGSVLRATKARSHHFEAAAGRIKRTKVITFQLLNMAVFLKRHASDPDAFLGAYKVMIYRRLLAEFLKDVLSKRWQLPQVKGVRIAMRHWREIWKRDGVELDAWYPEFQKKILEDIS